VGGTKTSLHFVWKTAVDEENESDTIDHCLQVIKKIEDEVPTYERRITKQNFHKAFGLVVDPVALSAILSELTGDNSAPVNLNEREIDAGILVNLRHQSPDKKVDTFKVFFEATEKYLAEDIGVACHERRHGQQLYIAKAISMKNLHQRVKERVPEGTNIPSVKWLRYQFHMH
jgi:hypothetical protein